MKHARSIVILSLVVGCGKSHVNGTHDAAGGGDGGGSATIDAFAGPWGDFPGAPIVDGTAPGTAGTLFGPPTSGAATGGPCLVEPEVGTLYPRNWLRPRFSWIASGGQNLFELRVSTPHETSPLVVYTTATSWTMPAAIWDALSSHVIDQPLTVAIRGATYDAGSGTLTGGPALGSTGDIAIAPADAPGAIVYWTTTGGTKLRGFKIGDETVTDVAGPADVGGGTQCVGCHSSTPDGLYVGFSATTVANNGDPATLNLLASDGSHGTPPFLTASAKTLMARTYQEEPVFSKLHWSAGDHVAVTMMTVASKPEITWTDLEATSTAQDTGWGVIARSGDSGNAAYASFAHAEDTLLYVSSSTVSSGVTVTHGNLATVPYGNRHGGTAATIAGADTTTYNEYYPTFAPDDRLVAYDRVADGSSSYNNAQAEVYVIPRAGGTPTRLRANDPPACGGQTSPGVTNSWPKWAPDTTDVGTRRFYWLTFASTRGAGIPQLYVTPVVDDGGTITTYPALYLWNQPAAEHNHTPAWDNFAILQ